MSSKEKKNKALRCNMLIMGNTAEAAGFLGIKKNKLKFEKKKIRIVKLQEDDPVKAGKKIRKLQGDLRTAVHGAVIFAGKEDEQRLSCFSELMDIVRNAGIPLQMISQETGHSTEEELFDYSEKGLHIINGENVSNKKDEILKQYLRNAHDYVSSRLVPLALEEIRDFLAEAKTQALSEIDNMNISVFNLEALEDADFEALFPDSDLIEEKLGYFEDYLDFAARINPDGDDPVDVLCDQLETLEELTEDMEIPLMQEMEEALEDMENGTVLEKAGGLLYLAQTALFLKQRLKEMICLVFDRFDQKLKECSDKFCVPYRRDMLTFGYISKSK